MRKGLRYGGIGLMVLGLIVALIPGLSGPGDPAGKLFHDLTVKEKVITGVYKVYGVQDAPIPMWLAKTIFRNDMDGRITDLKTRYRLGPYAEWSSWQQYPAVDPTQTVVDLYYPILSSDCARLTSRAPAELEMECEYTDPAGRQQTFSETQRLTMLSRHEFIFSDLTAEERTGSFDDQDTLSELLAAWVSRSDEPVARLASMANKKAGGLGASSSDENALTVMKELYDIMRTIHISYQHPQALADQGLSYDLKLVQSLQYPRDTIQKRSGTCIDLAILYAAMMNSVNITPYLVSMDGHCFPLAVLPSGNICPVEATGVGDGYENSMDFEKAVESATKTWQEINQNGRYKVIDVRSAWMAGASNPELEPLPADILEKWGIVELVEGNSAPSRQTVVAAPSSGRSVPQATPATPAAGAIQIAGSWNYTVTLPDGNVIGGQAQITGGGASVQMAASATYQAMGMDGYMHSIQEQSHFNGGINGSLFRAQCNNAQVNVDGYVVPPEALPWRLNLNVTPDGRSMQGQITNAMGMSAMISMQR